jgi:hypothetical protein
MGYSLAWTAVEQTSAAVLAQLGLAESDVRGDFYGFPLAGMTLPNGWYIVTAKACDHWIGSSRTLSKLSNACRVISCVVEEHVTYSSAAFWRDGRQKWAVRHRGGDFGIMDLVTEGSLPEDFAEIRARGFSRQAAAGGAEAEVDYVFEVPLELAESTVKFKHDCTVGSGIDMEGFCELRPIPPTAPDLNLLLRLVRPS